MKRKSSMKKMVFCMILGLLLMGLAVPVSAATFKKSKSVTIKKGQSYHLMNQNISKNKIKKCTLTVSASSGSKYDLALGCANGVGLLKNCTSRKESITLSGKDLFYIKSNKSSKQGMLMCLKVTKGKVKVTVKYTTGYKKGTLTFKKQKSSHQTLKSVTVKTGKKVSFIKRAGNVSIFPLLMAGKRGTVSRWVLNPYVYEKYQMGKKNILCQLYVNGKLQDGSLNSPYLGKNGTIYYGMIGYESNMGYLKTMKGTATYYYPTDYLKISVKR